MYVIREVLNCKQAAPRRQRAKLLPLETIKV